MCWGIDRLALLEAGSLAPCEHMCSARLPCVTDAQLACLALHVLSSPALRHATLYLPRIIMSAAAVSRPGTALSAGYGFPQRRPVLTSLGAAGSGPLARPATSRPGTAALNLQLPPAAAAAIAKAQRLAAAAERIAAVAAAAAPPTLELSLWRLASLIDTSDEMLMRCAGEIGAAERENT